MYTVLGNLGLLKVFVKIAIEVANKYNEQQELTNWLFEACEEGSIDGVKKSIEHGAKDTKTQDCLMEAIKNNNYEIAKLLIDSKTSSASGSDNIPIFVACRMNCEGTDNLSIIDLLLKNGADPISYSHGGAISFVIKEDKGGSSVPLLKKLLNIDDKYPYYILLENLKSYFKVCVDLNIEECLKVILQLGFEKYDFEGEWSSYIYSCIKIIEGTIKRLLHPDFMSPERKNKAARNQKMVDIMKEYLAKYGEKA
jgi:hypothetical protein